MALRQYVGVTADPADTVTVHPTGTLDLADLYEDGDGSTPLGNPFTSDLSTGDYSFWAEDVPYDIWDTTS